MRLNSSSIILAVTLTISCVGIADTWTDPETGRTWSYLVVGDTAWITQGQYSDWTGDLSVPDKLGNCTVTSIRLHAFWGCNGITSITIPENVSYLDYGAFFNCCNLTAFIVDPDNLEYKSVSGLLLTKAGDTLLHGVNGDVVIPNDVINIADQAFYSRSNLTNVTIPESVKRIGRSAFDGCSGLTCLTIPDSVTNIGYCAFGNCSGLTNMSIPRCLTTIDETFYGCSGITHMSIPNSVTSIGRYAFANCTSLTNLAISSSVTNIGYSAFKYCESLREVSIPNSVMNIGEQAFLGCRGLTNIIIGDCVTSIGERAFAFCYGLTSVIIPSSVTNIEEEAFLGCSGLANIYLARSFDGTVDCFPPDATIIRYRQQSIITLDANGGELDGPTSKTVHFGDAYGSLTVPWRSGYTFVGWKVEETFVDTDTIVLAPDDHTLVAEWQANQYVVTFDANGGEGGTSVLCHYESILVPPEVQRNGYTLVGWSPDLPKTTPSSNVTYTAQWQINTYKVVFDANGGIGSVTNEQDYASEIVAPDIGREGYTFLGWSPEVDTTVPASNVTYAAQWRINQYTVVFDVNGYAGSITNEQDYASGIVVPDIIAPAMNYCESAA